MFLDTTTKSLELVLGSAVTTNAMPVTVDYVDITTTTTTPGSSDTQSNGITAVTILAAPAASTQRKVNGIIVYNADTASKVVTIRLNNNTTLRQLVVATLSVGDSLIYTDVRGWYVQDTNGNMKVTTGTGGGSGTVTNVSSANADITVATPTTTPVLTLVQAPALRSATTTVDVSAATAPTSGQVLTATSGTAATWQTPAAGSNTSPEKLPTITATVATNALTIGITAQYLDFRSATLGSGTISTVNCSPASIVVPSTATLGTVNSVQSRLVVVVMNNGGTAELAVANISGGLQMDESNLISTTALSAAATANNVWYSTTARTSLPYRVVGYVESTQATAGTWATSPSTIQGSGGNALTAMSSLGYGQTWQDVTGSRTSGTTYYNTTSKPITVSATANIQSSATFNIVVNGVIATNASTSVTTSSIAVAICAVVPVGQSYICNSTNGISAIRELR